MDQTLTTTHFEACVEYRSLVHEAVCEECGWLEVDHAAAEPAVLAQVIRVPVRAARVLRRAS